VVGELEREMQLKLATGSGQKFIEALKSYQLWVLAVANLLFLSGVYGLSFWLPQMIKDFGVDDLFLNGLLAATPYAAACIGMVVVSQHSDLTTERKWHIVLSGLVGAAGLAICGAFARNPTISLVGLSLAMTGSLSGLAVMWSVPGGILTGAAAATGFALMATIGNIGGYLAPLLLGWIRQSTGQLNYGLYAMAAGMTLGTVVIGTLLSPRHIQAPRFSAAPNVSRL
jgi:MFS-type transporter involved in bile tolerance (Atg22 family)